MAAVESPLCTGPCLMDSAASTYFVSVILRGKRGALMGIS